MLLIRRAAILIPLWAFATANAYADDYQIDSPQVDAGEAYALANLNYSGDNRKNLDHYMSQIYGAGYGVTSFWATEIDAEIEKSSTLSTRFTTLKWTNTIAPFKPGEYWVDAGLYFEYDKTIQDRMPDNIQAKILLEKRIGDFINTANISFGHNIGPNSISGLDTGVSWRTKYHVNDWFEPGVEYYSDIGALNRDDDFNRQDSVVGPVVQGHFGEVTYDAGVLFGVSQSAHDVTIKLNLEYGF